MKRIENISNEALKVVTLPIRLSIGIFNAVLKHTPDTLDIPFEIKRKENKNGTEKRPQE